MKLTSIASMMMTVLCVVILTMAVVIPVIDQQEESIKEYNTADNSGQEFLMSKGTSSYAETINFVSASEGTSNWTIGGESVAVTGTDFYVWVCDTAIIYINGTGGTFMSTERASAGAISFHTGTTTVESVSFAAGTVTATLSSDSTIASAYTWVMYPDDSGDWGFFAPDSAFRASTNAEFYVVYANLAGLRSIAGYGTAGDIDPEVVHSSLTATFSATYTAQDTYDAVSAVSATIGGSSVTPTGSIAPIEYNASEKETDQSLTAMLVGIIPLILIVAVLLMAVSYIASRRD